MSFVTPRRIVATAIALSVPVACGFPEYTGFDAQSSAAGAAGAGGSGTSATGGTQAGTAGTGGALGGSGGVSASGGGAATGGAGQGGAGQGGAGKAGQGGTTGGSGGVGGPTGGTGGKSGTGGAAGKSGASGKSGAAGAATCQMDADCAALGPATPVCDTITSLCVACTATKDTCPIGTYCAADACVPGCSEDADCAGASGGAGGAGGGAGGGSGSAGKAGGSGAGGGPGKVTCDTAAHVCIGCTIDAECGPGTLCNVASATCVPGCSPTHACATGSTCCGKACADLATSVDHCGGCDTPCAPAAATGKCAAGVCQVASCNAGFGDCDGVASNGCEIATTTDTMNCGMCKNACPAAPNQLEACGAGVCKAGACKPGFTDCDGKPANGCEAALATDPNNCGMCGTACSANNGTPSCVASACAITCTAGFANCDGDASNGCEVDTTTNVNNCGSCNNACSAAGGTPACVKSLCTLSSCGPGKADCDGNPVNGCEVDITGDTSNCGGCGLACFTPNGTPACGAGTCFVASCTMGFANCNGKVLDGCEVNLATQANCGACGVACSLANATSSCATGACKLGACLGSFANCDGNDFNGCEANTTLDPLNCGACNNACMLANATSSCASGGCAIAACNAGFADCDGLAATGCEVQLGTTANCAACGAKCTNAHGTTACNASACVPSCGAGFGDCDGDPTNGCETGTTTLTNCGACGKVCAIPNATASCATGTCTFGVCNAGFADCNGGVNAGADGCEVNTKTDNANCGMCGKACAGGQVCANSVCVSTCPVGTADCDGNPANGCEVNLTNDGNHCGACATVCTSAQSCSNSVCTACPGGTNDCDKLGTNGCEVSTASDPNHCGGCATKCGARGTCGCSASACSGGTVYFSEDFSDNARGWTLGPEWAIGATAAGPAPMQGFPDPAADHSTTVDNGVAGIVLGGNYSVNPHPAEYLQSPPIDLSAAGGTVLLSYWRWLNTDSKGFTTDTVDVSPDGTTWTNVYTNPAVMCKGTALPTELDQAWSKTQFDVTAFKSATFRVRFGHSAQGCANFAPWIMSGWNVDDLSLSSAACN